MSNKLHELTTRIEKKYKTQIAFSEIMGMSNTNLNNKIRRKATLSSAQIEKMASLLDIRSEDIGRVFFPDLG